MPKLITRRSLIAAGGAGLVAGPAAARSRLARISGGAATGAPPVTTNFVVSITNLGTFFPSGVSHPLGMAITVGSQPITLTDVGRYMNAGDHLTHSIGIYSAPAVNGFTVPGGTASINMSGGTPGTFVYAPLAGPTALSAGATYYIMSLDLATGDAEWSPVVCVVTTDAALIGGADAGGSYPNITVTGGANHQHIPLDFKYYVGAPAVGTIVGSPYTGVGGGPNYVTITGQNGPVSGSVVLQAYSSTAPASGTLTYQWTLNGVPISPVLTWTNWMPANVLDWTFNTATKPDGTYIVYPIFLDWDVASCERITTYGYPLIIANSGTSVSAGQVVPFAPLSVHGENPRPDFLTYDGVPNPIHATYPIAYTFTDPSTLPGGLHNASGRDLYNWYGEVQPGPRNIEYYGAPQWARSKPGITGGPGGLTVQYINPLTVGFVAPTSYSHVEANNTMDGTRLNSLVSPYTNFVEDPDVSAQWWGVEITGRVFKIGRTGTVTTVFGPVRDKSVLTINADMGASDADFDAIRAFIGTDPGFGLDGANDICFDPRDHNILYMVCQITCWIAKINLTTLVATVYAGIPGTVGYVDGAAASAKFNQPTSIIMDSAGIMYVADQQNAAIRKITAGGTVSTLIGGSVGPGGVGGIPSEAAIATLSTGHAVSGTIVWNSGTQSAPVVLTSPASLSPGQTMFMSGAVNSAGYDVNYTNGGIAGGTRFVISAVADSTHFTIQWEQPSSPPPIGTLSGTMTLYECSMDLYSPPGTVGSFGATYCCYPNWLRFTSPGPAGGNIIFGEWGTNAARLIDLGASTVKRIGCFGNHLDAEPGGSWYFGDVDYAGTCGPIDDIFLWKLQDGISAAHYSWRCSLAVSAVPGRPVYTAVMFGDNTEYGLATYAPANALEGGSGHYPWGIGISRVEGRMISNGIADWQCVMYRIKQAGDPLVDTAADVNFNHAIWNVGKLINVYGTAPGFPLGSRPSFEALYGHFGGTFIMNGSVNTFEDMWGLSDGALTTFIQGGMGGSVPRPELTGNALRSWKYFIKRGTMQGSLGPTPFPPGADDPDTSFAVFISLTATRLSSTSIQVSHTTSKSTIGLAGAGSTQQAVTFGYFPMYSAIESSFGTSHVHTITVPAGMSPVYVTALAKDNAGNFVYSTPMAVT